MLGRSPRRPEFSQISDEFAHVFPSDHDLTCPALSVNLCEYVRLWHDASARFDELLRHRRGL